MRCSTSREVNVGRLLAPVDASAHGRFRERPRPHQRAGRRPAGLCLAADRRAGNNATDLRPDPSDELAAINASVWESIDQLAAFAYRTEHREFVRRRQEWFATPQQPYLALWWVPAGHTPSLDECLERLAHLRANGPTAHAFDFRTRFPAPAAGERGMKAAVIVFPGSNCDRDCKTAIERSTGATVEMVWHAETALPAGHRPDRAAGRLRLWRLPALRGDGGAIAGDEGGEGRRRARRRRRSASATASRSCARRGMLPGALLRNAGLKYVCKPVDLEVVNSQTRFTAAYRGKRRRRDDGRQRRGELLRRRRRRSIGSRARARSCSATPTTRTARRATSPASSTTAATCSA